MKWLGLGVTLAILPLMSAVGITTLGIWPTLGAFVVFTVVSSEDKYKAKNFIDAFVYRSGYQIGAWS